MARAANEGFEGGDAWTVTTRIREARMVEIIAISAQIEHDLTSPDAGLLLS
jgi:hypothetical protein